MEDKIQILTFKHKEEILGEEIHIKEIQQGDIFRNIPYYSPDFLLKSSSNTINASTTNEAESIFKDIIENGSVIKAKSIIYPTWAILGSQECDIRKGYDLIFFPLVKCKMIEEEKEIAKFIEEDIQKLTRFMYIPKIDLQDDGFGPFRVLLQNPFYISYEIIEKNLKFCWATHIIEKARRVFVGKLTNLFTRTPVDELVFIKFDKIEDYFHQMWRRWKNAWKDENLKKNHYYKSAEEIIEKIFEFYFLLKNENQEVRFQEFKILPIDFLNVLIGLIEKSWIFKEENLFKSYYNQLEEDKTLNRYMRFYKFIEKIIIGNESIFKFLKERLTIIQDLNNEEYLKYKDEKIKEEFQKLDQNIIISKLRGYIPQEQEFLSYYEPFKKLKEFLSNKEILEE